ncbi:MAG: bifunctional metallophosphatase/5'-nucleotidase [Terriglobia bacterium]
MKRLADFRSTRGRVFLFTVAVFVLGAAITGSGVLQSEATQPEVEFWLTVLHNNDGESQLINAGSGLEDFGGVARFATLVEQLRGEATPHGKRGVILVSSGDNFLAGPEFNASLEKGVPFFDSIAMDEVRYDAIALGNHEFDFGPDVLADFIRSFERPVPFVSANLDFSAEPSLQALVDEGRIARSVVVNEGERIGIVGATTPNLPFISSPRNVGVDPDVAGTVQAEIDQLESLGVNIIVLISHLQGVQEDLNLLGQLRGVDIAVAGGGDELLANPGDLLIPGDEGNVFDLYPLFATDADGNQIPVITTSGDYRYIGRLVAGFDYEGNLVAIDTDDDGVFRGPRSGPKRVSGVAPDAVEADPKLQAEVVAPVEAAVAALASNVIGTSQVALDGRRSPGVRTMETNEGNLVADALLFQATQLAASFGVPAPDVALQNGGGIRNNNVIPAGNITELDTFDMLPFPNFVTIIPGISRSQFKEILENAVSRAVAGDTPGGTGRFAQVAGFTMIWDATGTAQVLDLDENVLTPGTRVQEVVVNGTTIVTGGAVVAGPALTVATIDFLARGGDQYPFRGAPFTAVGVTYQQALRNFIVDSLLGTITAAQYPEGGEGRITRLN